MTGTSQNPGSGNGFAPRSGPASAGYGSLLVAASIWILSFWRYATTLAPGIAELFDDSLEFQYVAPTLGIAHPTGYPLYTLLGFTWSRVLIPFGNWAWRMNLLSAILGATGVLLVFLVVVRLSQNGPDRAALWAGLITAASFALGPVWSRQTTLAEVYALHIVFLAGILLATVSLETWCIGWQDKSVDSTPFADQGTGPRRTHFSIAAILVRHIGLICFLFGLSLTHHRTTVLVAPALTVYLLWCAPAYLRLRQHSVRNIVRDGLLWAGALLVPLLLYLYLPLRAATGVRDLHGSYVQTWQGFWDHVLARGYFGFFDTGADTATFGLTDWIRLVRHELGLLPVVLAVFGVVQAFRPQGWSWRVWILILLVLGSNMWFAFNYHVGDRDVFLLPTFLAVSLLAGAGAGLVMQLSSRRSIVSHLIGGILLVAIISGLGGRGMPVDRSDDWFAHTYAWLMASTPFPAGSQVIGLEGEMTALRYMQAESGLGIQATPVVADDPGQRRRLLDHAMATGIPVFLTRELAGIETVYSFSGSGPLIRVWPRGQIPQVTPSHNLDLSLLNGAMFINGYDLVKRESPGGPLLQLTLYWEPLDQLTSVLKVSLRMVDGNGSPVLNTDQTPVQIDRYPLRQVSLTPHWVPGETVSDVYFLPWNGSSRADGEQIHIVIYNAETIEEVARFEIAVTVPS